jgi:cobalt/nickel transport system ATP-binding protein
MHFHAEHSLFFEQRQSLWRPVLSLCLTVGVVIVNAGAGSTALSMIGASIAALLLVFAYVGGQRRMEPALAWTLALVVSALLGSVALGGDLDRFTEAAARISCGVLWVLWLGTQMDWASLRRIFVVTGIPDSVVSSLDHAVMNGILTRQEWALRRDAARLRLGNSRLPIQSWSQLLGEGAMSGFLRLESMEENALLRSSPVVGSGSSGVVQLEAVHIERDSHVVLEQLNLRIGAGECVLLCGPSGAGKSSLLRLLAGLDGPAQGCMTRLGVTVSPGDPLRRRLDGRVALLSQNPEHHFIASTVAEDIAWGLLRRDVETAEARRRAAEMAKALGVEKLLERPCHALSFGEQRRVALAGLLVQEPALLLLDEPTSGLDPVAAHELRNLVEQLTQRTGAACIWATHDLQSVPAQAGRVVLLRDRRMVFDGESGEGLSESWLVRAGLAVPQAGENAC